MGEPLASPLHFKGQIRTIAKHRFFVFLDATILPDDKLIAIASDDAFIQGALSSRVHVVWSLATHVLEEAVQYLEVRVVA